MKTENQNPAAAQPKAAHTWHWEFHPDCADDLSKTHYPIALIEDDEDVLLITDDGEGNTFARISPEHQRLIAAAPELLAALNCAETQLRWLESNHADAWHESEKEDVASALGLIRAAILKAGGAS